MFTKNVFTQKDPIADLVKPMLEAQAKAKMEELKGNQAVLDKNKNNKLDAQDFKILRGEKKAVKEENVEESSPFDWKKPREPEVKGGAGVKAGRAYGGAAQKSKPEQDDADDKKKVKEEVELKEGLGHWVVKQMARLANKNDLEHHHVNVAQKEVDRKLGTGHPQATSILNKHKKMARDAQYHKKSDDEARQHFADNMQTLHNDIKSAHSVKEEVEQLDELSRKTMKSYMKKAEPDAVQSVAAAHDKVEKYIDKTGKAPSSPKHVMKIAGNEIMRAAKRTKGVERATTKLAKEEVEQIDELSKSTLGSYVKSAARDVGASRKLAADFKNQADKSRKPAAKAASSRLSDKFYDVAQKRHKGIGKAVERLTKEELELEEGAFSSGALKPSKKALDAISKTPSSGTVRDKDDKGVYTAKTINGKEVSRSYEKSVKEEVEQVDERTLTKGETAERERIVKGMKKGLAGFKARYGDRAKSVMYATATKAAKKD
jgi:hypothetical protein